MRISRSRERSRVRLPTPERSRSYSSSSSPERDDDFDDNRYRRSRSRRRSPSQTRNAASRSRSRSPSGSKSSKQSASDLRWSILNSDIPDHSSRGESPRRHSVNSVRYPERGRPRLRKSEWPSYIKPEDGNIVFISNMNNVVTEKDLSKKFLNYGAVRQVCILKDVMSNESRGIALVSMDKEEDANAAVEALDHSQWRGRIIFVERCPAH